MKHAVLLLGILCSGSAFAAPGDSLDTMNRGDYFCELPGDATGRAGFPVAEEAFTITTGSSYSTARGSGSYLLVGDRLTMTSGPKRGQKYKRLSDNFLRKLESDGSEGKLRCVRRMRING
jgi:hypothetical protein